MGMNARRLVVATALTFGALLVGACSQSTVSAPPEVKPSAVANPIKPAASAPSVKSAATKPAARASAASAGCAAYTRWHADFCTAAESGEKLKGTPEDCARLRQQIAAECTKS